jgi:hypothetical protein
MSLAENLANAKKGLSQNIEIFWVPHTSLSTEAFAKVEVCGAVLKY